MDDDDEEQSEHHPHMFLGAGVQWCDLLERSDHRTQDTMASFAAGYAKTGTQIGIGKAVRGSSVSAEADDAAFDSQYTIGEDGDIEAIPMLNQQVDKSRFIFSNSARFRSQGQCPHSSRGAAPSVFEARG